ncbi:MAG: 3-deoxy-manno-octulosonate cytidylyltransferase [Saprospiraceae bacterium]
MKIIGIIPARFESTRFPGKPLVSIAGVPMIQRVYEQAKKVERFSEVVVATDDERIFDFVENFGGKVQMTKASHINGTERCAEVAEAIIDADIIINIQGDEPFIAPAQIDLLIDQLIAQQRGIATLAKQLFSERDWKDANIVKVLFDKNYRVLYFSRAAIPYNRSTANNSWNTNQHYYKHIGLYGYYRDTVLEICTLKRTPLELSESLEQLRWLENGFEIGIAITNSESISVDHPSDVSKAEKWLSDK